MRLLLCLAAAAAVDWQVPAYQSALTETGLRELLGVDDDQATPLIASVHRLGLANRLRSLAAAHVFATDANVELVVRWKAERGCDCEAEDLFRAAVAFIQGQRLGPRRPPEHGQRDPAVRSPETVVRKTRPRHSIFWTVALVFTRDTRRHKVCSAIILDPRGQFAHHQIDCREFLHRKRAFYQRVDDAAMRVAGLNDTLVNLRNALQDKFVVGLHVRTYDPSFDWPVVPPPDVSVESSTTWDESAPVRVHFEAARRVLKRHPRAVIFLASNDASVKARAKREFKDSELIFADWGRRHEGDAEAWGSAPRWRTGWCWGMLPWCCTPSGSSFGEEESASRIGVPSVRLRSGGHVLGVDINRDNCGHVGMRAAETDGEEHCFDQAGAQVCSPPLELKPCGLEEPWGLPDVFC